MDPKLLREEFARIHAEAQKLLTETKGKYTDEQKAEQDKRYARMDEIKGLLAEIAKQAEYAKALGSVQEPADPAGKQAVEGERQQAGAAGGKPVEFALDLAKKALNQFARTGSIDRDLFTVISTSGSSAMLPKQVLLPIEIRRMNNAILAFLARFNQPIIEVDVPATFSLPTVDDTANTGATINENATEGTKLDATVAGLTLDGNTLYSSKQMWFSNTMILGQSFDVMSYMLPILQKRVDKHKESLWVTALIAGTVGKTLASPTAITYSEILDWEHSLSAAYRVDAGYIVSDTLLKAVRGLLDGNDRPLFHEQPEGPWAGTIHGKPVIPCDYMETFAADNVIGAICSAEALKVLEVRNKRLARYVQDKDMPDQTGFELFENGDFDFVSAGVRTLKTAAS